MQRIITIVGGKGMMGKLFTSYWRNIDYIIHSLDIEDWANASTLLTGCDLVLISVPINCTAKIISNIAQYLSPTTILADLTSIKVTPLELMLQMHNGPVLGLHPMFGPTITSPQNQVIINCDGRDQACYTWFIEDLKRIGFTLKSMSAAEHDQAMTFIQGIEHFSTFILGSFLHKHQQHPKDLFNLASPIYQAKLALMGRIFDQDAQLYADIITADSDRLDFIDEYAKYLQDWVAKLRQNKIAEFINEFNQTSEWMGNFTNQAQYASDKFLTAVTDSFPTIKS